jgi:hypothetical protein
VTVSGREGVRFRTAPTEKTAVHSFSEHDWPKDRQPRECRRILSSSPTSSRATAAPN